jgi:hypothetical protein
MYQTLPVVEELVRIPSPCPPFGLACDGPNLWVGSNVTNRIYGLDSRNGKVFEECAAPQSPYGLAVTGDALRVIIADANDDRYLSRYVMGKDFKRSETCGLPNHTGSSLAYDGDALFVCQRYDQKIVEIDGRGRAIREIPTPQMAAAMTIVGGRFYLLASPSKESTDFTLIRMDVRGDEPEIVELAAVRFSPKALAFDGRRFWATDKKQNVIIAFAKPDD